jgi:chromosome partitioning protein
MEGDFGEFDLASVIQVVSIGRQYTGVDVFDHGGHVVGNIFLKSGKILAASSGSASGIDAVASLMRGGPHKRFSVYRTDPFTDVISPVGSVGEILLKLTETEPTPEERIPVMEGDLVEFDLLSVLQVISIGRQFAALELRDARGNVLGVIKLKAGKVLSATAGHLTGIDAIRRLARCPRDSRFVVYRSRSAVAEHHLGPLGQILLKLADPDDQWDAVEQNTRAKAATVVEARGPSAPAQAPAAPRHPPPPPTTPQIEVKGEPSESRAWNASFIEAQTNPGGLRTVGQSTGVVPVIAVTSPKGGAGKTTVALNLGVAFARQGKRAVLVDADGNGVLLALNAAAKAGAGAYDVALGRTRFSHAAIQTRIPGFRIMPTGDPAAAPELTKERWSEVFAEARVDADVVLVDTSAGLQGPSGAACAAATHALVVLPAEPTAVRGLPWHMQRLAALGQGPAQVIGLVLNQLDYRARVSLDVLRDVCAGPSSPWVFDVPIARSPAFMEAVARGVPVCRGERADTPTIGWVFEMLASGILERLGIVTPAFDDSLL